MAEKQCVTSNREGTQILNAKPRNKSCHKSLVNCSISESNWDWVPSFFIVKRWQTATSIGDLSWLQFLSLQQDKSCHSVTLSATLQCKTDVRPDSVAVHFKYTCIQVLLISDTSCSSNCQAQSDPLLLHRKVKLASCRRGDLKTREEFCTRAVTLTAARGGHHLSCRIRCKSEATETGTSDAAGAPCGRGWASAK